jgi:glycosyltransferase 2 family protein
MKPRHPRWRTAMRVTFAVFLVAVGVLLWRAAQSIDWSGVTAAIAGYSLPTLASAVALTLASYLVHCGYDLAARRYAHHTLSTRRVMVIAFISYAFSLNIGALIGGTGFRFRLYAYSGLGVGATSRAVVFSVSSNWLGYLLLTGALFVTHSTPIPPQWNVGTSGIEALGLAMLATMLAYLVACRLSHGRVFHFRGRHFRLPTLTLGIVQLALSSANWAIQAAVIYVLLPDHISYAIVLGTLLVAAIASALAHIPAGIGVIEAVFIALLGHLAPPAHLLAALLAFRAVYYLVPLLIAVGLYVAFEARGRRAG